MNQDLKVLANQVLNRSKSRTSARTDREQPAKNLVHSNEKANILANKKINNKVSADNLKGRFWKPEELSLIEWFQKSSANLPIDSFQLKQGINVVDPIKFYNALRTDLMCGPQGARALFGAFQEDLRLLKKNSEQNELQKEVK